MNIVFLMDPLDSIQRAKDTTYQLMRGAHQRQHGVYFLPVGGISLQNNQLFLRVQKVIPTPEGSQPFKKGPWKKFSPTDFQVLFVRTDPPFDETYLMQTWLLERLPPSVFVINDPAGIRSANEKIWMTQFEDVIPPLCITRHAEDFQQFWDQHQDIILKPTDGFGGHSVFRLKKDDTNGSVAFETLTQKGRKEVVVQKYLPEAEKGDKRLLLLNGEPLGAVLRVHAPGDHRNNFFAGGTPHATDMTPRDREIVHDLKPHLQRNGLFFVGIDIIGRFLIEVNVTSPTCLQEMNRLYGTSLENKVLDFVEGQVAQRAPCRA